MKGLIKPEDTEHSTTVRGYIVFTDEGEKMKNKEIKDYIDVLVVVDIEWGDTRERLYNVK